MAGYTGKGEMGRALRAGPSATEQDGVGLVPRDRTGAMGLDGIEWATSDRTRQDRKGRTPWGQTGWGETGDVD